jgi:histidyl-tRNA synthetase
MLPSALFKSAGATYDLMRCLASHLQHAERLNASRLVLVGSSEWSRGAVSVKDLAAREQKEVPVAELVASVQPTGQQA